MVAAARTLTRRCSTCTGIFPDTRKYFAGNGKKRGYRCHECNRKRVREWQSKHKDRVAERVAAWKEAHPDRVKRSTRAWRINNPRKMKAQRRRALARKKLARQVVCECGNPRAVGAEACERCSFLDGRTPRGTVRAVGGTVIALLRILPAPVTIDALTMELDVTYHTVWTMMRRLIRDGRVAVRYEPDPFGSNERPVYYLRSGS
jgi:hypothetical protein